MCFNKRHCDSFGCLFFVFLYDFDVVWSAFEYFFFFLILSCFAFDWNEIERKNESNWLSTRVDWARKTKQKRRANGQTAWNAFRNFVWCCYERLCIQHSFIVPEKRSIDWRHTNQNPFGLFRSFILRSSLLFPFSVSSVHRSQLSLKMIPFLSLQEVVVHFFWWCEKLRSERRDVRTHKNEWRQGRDREKKNIRDWSNNEVIYGRNNHIPSMVIVCRCCQKHRHA